MDLKFITIAKNLKGKLKTKPESVLYILDGDGAHL